MQDKYSLLRKFYGYDSFRSGQEKIIDTILSGRDVLAVMPTGAGKSICYQIPALMTDGITLVISPLISLMRDQVSALNQHGIPAAFLNSSLTLRQYSLALQRASVGAYKIIYVAPERLETEGFIDFAKNANISLIAVDEAHCVSQWGHDFRRSYTGIADFVDKLQKRPVVAAFTATATEMVKTDVRRMLGLTSPFEITTGFDRPNLYFGVEYEIDKDKFIFDYLSKNPGKSGIIYAMTRKNVEKLYTELSSNGFPVTMYHAGLSDEIRNADQEEFIRDKKPIMIATNAFGMGIDKPDVNFIIHYNMPLSMESYYQEAGRAGRDASDAECILLYSVKDIHTAKFLIENGGDESLDPADFKVAKQARYDKLNRMIKYCESKECLRSFILNYFGEKDNRKSCGKCSSCLDDFEIVDVTKDARAVYMAVINTGERYGVGFITDYLLGVGDERISRSGFSAFPSFASMSGMARSYVRDLIEYLIEIELLERSGGEYPILSVTHEFDSAIDERRIITMRFRETKPKKPKTPQKILKTDGNVDAKLYEELRDYRREMADKRSLPAYVICTDMTLRQLATLKPTSIIELEKIRGVGDAFISRYGTAVLSIIKNHK